ncbi:MAG: hypothetical protein ACJAZ4_002757 [Neptuniibacter pectenicola]|jgi:hypothetical protein|tara:strand:- start:1827 stop:1955 length:129 start_codon:yes stop_codon:yes gene_type:complete
MKKIDPFTDSLKPANPPVLTQITQEDLPYPLIVMTIGYDEQP